MRMRWELRNNELGRKTRRRNGGDIFEQAKDLHGLPSY